MKNIPRISESEWQVMRVLWSNSPSTANKIVEALSKKTSWKPKTIKTLINRLVQKKAIDFEKKGREYLYFPVATEADCVKAESRNFLQRVYGGSLKPMLAAFIEEENLSAEDIKELKKILAKKGGK
jgi:BlaI family penicillinase repressor